MLRVIVQSDNAGMAANVGGHVLTTYETFLIDAPILEEFVSRDLGNYGHRQVVGVELVKQEAQP